MYNVSMIENEIKKLQERISATDFADDEYRVYQEELKAWQELKKAIDAEAVADKKDKANRRAELLQAILKFAQTGVATAGCLLGIIIITGAEELIPKIFNSKAMSLVTKMLPKLM